MLGGVKNKREIKNNSIIFIFYSAAAASNSRNHSMSILTHAGTGLGAAPRPCPGLLVGAAVRFELCFTMNSRSLFFSKHVCFEREKVVASMSDSLVLTTSDHPCYQALLGPIKRHS